MVPYTLGKESYPYKSIGCNLVWFRPLVPYTKPLKLLSFKGFLLPVVNAYAKSISLTQ